MFIACIVSGCVVVPIPVTMKQPLPPRPTQSDAMDEIELKMLEAHNRYRTEIGVPPLFWSRTLAEKAKRWADYLAASVHGIRHENEPGVGQNIGYWTTGQRTPVQFIDWWAAEMTQFRRGTFPDVSQTGDWDAVGHYTQIVWRDTAQVGCASATDGSYDYFVCDYTPQGNIRQQPVY
jgi:hypothetical protein